MSLALPTSAWGFDNRRARGTRRLALLLADVADGDGVALVDEVLEHGKPHAPSADDAHAIFFVFSHVLLPII